MSRILVVVRCKGKLIDALDRSIASMAPGTSRPEAIRFILQDWLTGAGFIRFNEEPASAN